MTEPSLPMRRSLAIVCSATTLDRPNGPMSQDLRRPALENAPTAGGRP
jgi:hypothetical protein